MKNFIIKVLVFLLTLFPSSEFLLANYQQVTYPGPTVVVDNVMNAIKTGDIAALEAMMNTYNKEKIEDLPGKISKFIDVIDGEIIEYSLGGGYEKDYGGYSLRSWGENIITDAESYYLIITWIVVNTRIPDKVGLSSIAIFDSENNLLAEVYAPEE